MSTTTIDLDRVNQDLESRSAEDILRWSVETFGDRFAIQSSMQKTAGVLMHMISLIAPQTEIIFVDTDVHFRETLETRDEFQKRFNLNMKTYHPAKNFEEQYKEFGRYLHETDDTIPGSEPGYRHCCFLRKEVPFISAVKGRFEAIGGGLMRSEGGKRASIPIVGMDKRVDSYKIYPLANWTMEDVDRYTREHDLPVHPLYAKSYTSIGCFTCTTPVKPGEDPRAGRWRHIREKNQDLQAQPIYCGINIEDRKS